VLPIVVLQVLATIADLALGFTHLDTAATSSSFSATANLGPVSLVMTVLLIVPSIASQVTRLHDRGHSAWWLLFSLIPIAGAIVLLVQTGFLRGDGGPNRYGPPPGPKQPFPDPPYPASYR
jgi:uncharacterized membrane protein YhaH (DUF805 family)